MPSGTWAGRAVRGITSPTLLRTVRMAAPGEIDMLATAAVRADANGAEVDSQARSIIPLYETKAGEP